MKPRHTSSNKMGKPTSGRSAKTPFKSQNQPGPSSKKKGSDDQGRKQGQKRQQVRQKVRREVKEFKDYSPGGENGSTKKVKLSSAKLGSWQPLSENSRLFLENIVDSVVLSVLSQQRKKNDDVQKHLNALKKRVLRSFRSLKVPPGELGNLKSILSLQMAEKQMLETNEESLVQLQEEINEAEQSAERTEENIQQLKYKIQVLKNQLEEDEKDARKEVLLKEGLICLWKWIFLIFPTSAAELRSLVLEVGYSGKMTVEHSTSQNSPSTVFRHPFCRRKF